MRLHRLEVTAFGPFAQTTGVDLDELSSHGLFLLHGATGAGKTSLLDAVCFALYNQVPGRRNAGALRSDLAAVDAEPVVTLEFSVGSRRFQIRRSPAWERPKLRGSGTTTQQAAVRVTELVAGEWTTRATRLDEAGLLIADVVGMNLDQFTKVVMLPQGEFAAFLHAPADQRRNLLQRLFGTERFEVVEKLLAEQRREMARQCEESTAQRDALAARVTERLTSVRHLIAWPQETQPEGGEPLAAQLIDAIEDALEPAREVMQQTALQLNTAREELTHHQEHADAFAQWSRALQQQNTLEQERPAVEQAQNRLEAAARATAVVGPLEILTRDERELADALRDQSTSLHAITPLLAAQTLPGLGLDMAPTEEDLSTAAAERRSEIGHLDRLLTVEQQKQTWQQQLRQLETNRAALQEKSATTDQQVAQLAKKQHELQEQAAGAARTAATAEGARGDLELAQARSNAATELARIQTDLHEAQERRRNAVDKAQSARAHALDLTRRRLQGIAAELAAGLLPGHDCPVCGAAEHPRPATATEEHVSPEEEEQAQLAAEQAEKVADQAAQAVATIREHIIALEQASGGLTPEQARDRLTAAHTTHRLATQAAEQELHLNRTLDQIRTTLPEAHAEQARLREALAELAQDITEVTTRLTDAQKTLEKAQGNDDSVWSRHERLTREAKLLESARDSVARFHRADATARRARAAALKSCRAAGFIEIAHATAAQLTEELAAVLQRQIQDHRDQEIANTAELQRLSRPEWTAGNLTTAHLQEQLTAAKDALAQAEEAHQEQTSVVDWLTQTLAGVQDLQTQLIQWRSHFAPLQERFEVIKEISACAEGSGSNTLRMRLSAYVLAARLDQVTQAASLHLSRMSADRYTLIHTDSTRRGTGRAGLGIAVVDAWTGRERDPNSLSGGETFLASLSLALGLADVVQAEAGGSTIETLFVDEGFGSLDDESLDLVMDTLDGLREGGRAVGVVSHVPELRMRIPAQLEVRRSPTGSTVVMR